jgi:hypothetical protein
VAPIATRRWVRTSLWLTGLLLAAVSLALSVNLLILKPLIPGRTSPRVRQVEPLPLAEGLGISAGLDLDVGVPSGDAPSTNELDLSSLIAAPEETEGVHDGDDPDSKIGRRRSNRTSSLRGGYRALGPRSYVVKRSWLQEAGKRGPGASATPHVVNGEVKGYRLRGVGGPLAQIGLRSGDVITAINGTKTNSPDHALRAYQSAYKAKVIRVSLLRGGAPTTYTYQMVD